MVLRFCKKLRPLITVLFPILLITGVLIILSEWRLSFVFSIVLPVLVIVNFVQLFFLLYKRKKLVLLNIISLLLFFLFFDFFYQFSFNTEQEQHENSITVLSYNAHWSKSGPARDKKIVDFIGYNNADIVCFQEFSAIKYKFFVKDYPHWVKTNLMIPNQKSVLAVFSKYPILNKGYIEFLNSLNNAMFVDIDVDGKIVRVYNVHLESNRTNTMHQLNNISSYKPLITRIFEAEKTRTAQAHLVKEHMDSFDGNVIVAGDFNCTQYASAYLVLKDAMKDTFVEAGKGFGGTYELFNYPFKIDHILVDDAFEVVNHQNFDINLSDHEPVLAEIKFKD